MDVTTKEGDFQKYHGTVGIGLIDGRLQFEGPIIKNRTSFNFGLRRSWLDILTTPAFAIQNAKNKKMAKSIIWHIILQTSMPKLLIT